MLATGGNLRRLPGGRWEDAGLENRLKALEEEKSPQVVWFAEVLTSSEETSQVQSPQFPLLDLGTWISMPDLGSNRRRFHALGNIVTLQSGSMSRLH